LPYQFAGILFDYLNNHGIRFIINRKFQIELVFSRDFLEIIDCILDSFPDFLGIYKRLIRIARIFGDAVIFRGSSARIKRFNIHGNVAAQSSSLFVTHAIPLSNRRAIIALPLLFLLEQRQDDLRRLVTLSQHGGAGCIRICYLTNSDISLAMSYRGLLIQMMSGSEQQSAGWSGWIPEYSSGTTRVYRGYWSLQHCLIDNRLRILSAGGCGDINLRQACETVIG
jgi:hypothetical protein